MPRVLHVILAKPEAVTDDVRKSIRVIRDGGVWLATNMIGRDEVVADDDDYTVTVRIEPKKKGN